MQRLHTLANRRLRLHLEGLGFLIVARAALLPSVVQSNIDPGTIGYSVPVASSLAIGCPINFNYLISNEYVIEQDNCPALQCREPNQNQVL